MKDKLIMKPKTDKYDVKAIITNTGERKMYTGFRPAHMLNSQLTTGLHTYIGKEVIAPGESTEVYITFIAPEHYPESVITGGTIEFYDGSKKVGHAKITEVYNDYMDKEHGIRG